MSPEGISLAASKGGFDALISRFASKRILVIGDLMLDEFVWGRVSRISPEAPVPVVEVVSESYYPGGAANVARNVREFTEHTAVAGRIGADAHGERLASLLAASGIDASAVMREADYPTSVKTRVIARNQQVVRVDRESKAPLTGAETERAMRLLSAAMENADAVIVADYGKGYLTQPLADSICAKARERGALLAVDPHPHTSLAWHGAAAIKPNRAEAFMAAGLAPSAPVYPPTADQAVLEAGKRLLARWETGALLITLGEQGMLLFTGAAAPYHTPARAKEVFDVSGAGDTAIAVFTLGLAAGASPVEAAELANRASSIAVSKLGTATVTPDELRAACVGL